ncbi:MAG: DUF4956 domain-containing protein [Saprospiraceae bacterium]|nr:DUF4956 domain-containing protein [Saprospiraceae bacterium]
MFQGTPNLFSYAEGSLYMVLITAVLTILLSLVLVFTYDKTTPPAGRSNSFIQSLLLMSTVAAMIMQSIGDSLALSFGIFGALAIIRFRSNVSDLRDISFIFATMAIGIACGVHSFLIAVIGTFTFSLLVFLLKLSPFDPKHNVKGNLRIEASDSDQSLINVEKILEKYGQHINLSRYRMNISPEQSEINEFEYSFTVRDVKLGNKLREELTLLEGVKITRILFEDYVYTSNNN